LRCDTADEVEDHVRKQFAACWPHLFPTGNLASQSRLRVHFKLQPVPGCVSNLSTISAFLARVTNGQVNCGSHLHQNQRKTTYAKGQRAVAVFKRESRGRIAHRSVV
jgi:hypothetical protein